MTYRSILCNEEIVERGKRNFIKIVIAIVIGVIMTLLLWDYIEIIINALANLNPRIIIAVGLIPILLMLIIPYVNPDSNIRIDNAKRFIEDTKIFFRCISNPIIVDVTEIRVLIRLRESIQRNRKREMEILNDIMRKKQLEVGGDAAE